MKMFGSWLAIVSMALAIGCNKSDTAGVKEDSTSKALAAAADKPDVYVQTLINSLVDGQAKAVWTALPAKYQSDATGLKNEFAAKMDPDIWNKAFAVIGKVSQVLKTKKEMLLASPMIKENGPPIVMDGLNKNWDTVVGIVDAIAQSEIKTYDGLKSGDVGVFLDGTGSKLLSSALKIVDSIPALSADNKIKKVKVSQIKLEGDTATLKIETEGEAPPKTDYVFKKVDGKWLPAQVVADWDGTISQGKAYVADFNIAPELKGVAVPMLNFALQNLDVMLSANDQATFDKALMTLMVAGQGLAGPPPEALGSPGTPGGLPLGAPTTTGPGSLPLPGSLPRPAASIPSPTLPGAGAGSPPSSSIPSTPDTSKGPSLGTPETKLQLPK